MEIASCRQLISTESQVEMTLAVTYFADITEPDVGQGAGSLAVDAFELILSDDHVAQGRSILQDEHGIVIACLVRIIS